MMILFACLLVFFAYTATATPLASRNSYDLLTPDGTRREIKRSAIPSELLDDGSVDLRNAAASHPRPSHHNFNLKPRERPLDPPYSSSLSTRAKSTFRGSSRPRPDSSFKSSSSSKDIKSHFTSLYFVDPLSDAFHLVVDDVKRALDTWRRWVEALDAVTPTHKYFALLVGGARIILWSPLPIAWTVVTEILKIEMLLGLVAYGALGRAMVVFTTAGAVLVGMEFVQRRLGG
ncbi:MAG: hypothetical protein Q9169_007976 [Polycauliona sp. 2 TL-2023]